MGYQVHIDNVRFAFDRKQNYFFNDLSLVLESGRSYILTGRNGSGKSTFFRVLRGDIHEQELASGKIIFQENNVAVNIATEASILANYIALVQQDYTSMLISQFTAEENLRLAALSRFPPIAPLPVLTTISCQALKSFDIPLGVPVKLLSGGQRQLIAIMAILQKPVKMLLLDEPTAALDKQNKDSLMVLLSTIAQQRNIVVMSICHDKEIENKYDKKLVVNLADIQHKSKY